MTIQIVKRSRGVFPRPINARPAIEPLLDNLGFANDDMGKAGRLTIDLKTYWRVSIHVLKPRWTKALKTPMRP
ncbi:hypothetical protein K3727_03075 [Rhodobacteraceae bacterium M382]|nr:hypothetical protein K3727_03075 [Rhodobacteraceae bacterium M382]